MNRVNGDGLKMALRGGCSDIIESLRFPEAHDDNERVADLAGGREGVTFARNLVDEMDQPKACKDDSVASPRDLIDPGQGTPQPSRNNTFNDRPASKICDCPTSMIPIVLTVRMRHSSHM